MKLLANLLLHAALTTLHADNELSAVPACPV